MNLIEVYKQTNDNWYPSFKLLDNHNLVLISFFKYDDCDEWCVCAEGNDDMSIEINFDTKNKAWQFFVEVIGNEFVDIEYFQSLKRYYESQLKI
jgi:hypothetical protein